MFAERKAPNSTALWSASKQRDKSSLVECDGGAGEKEIFPTCSARGGGGGGEEKFVKRKKRDQRSDLMYAN
jgi:hypothetical protein